MKLTTLLFTREEKFIVYDETKAVGASPVFPKEDLVVYDETPTSGTIPVPIKQCCVNAQYDKGIKP